MKVRINTHGNPCPTQHGDWIDLRTAEEVYLNGGESRNISLGVSIEIPEGYYAEVVPRSSTFKKYGVTMTNSVGIIDNAYCGDNDIWQFPAMAHKVTFIPRGVRICQFRLVEKAPTVEFEMVDKLGNIDRGGFGSTGEK